MASLRTNLSALLLGCLHLLGRQICAVAAETYRDGCMNATVLSLSGTTSNSTVLVHGVNKGEPIYSAFGCELNLTEINRIYPKEQLMPGTWYKIIHGPRLTNAITGSGVVQKGIKASTCQDGAERCSAGFLKLFRGPASCEESQMNCLMGDPDFCEERGRNGRIVEGSMIRWISSWSSEVAYHDDYDYLVVVSEYGSSFTLQLEEFEVPHNYDCVHAEPLRIMEDDTFNQKGYSSVVPAQTGLDTILVNFQCPNIDRRRHHMHSGVWFSFLGNGAYLKVGSYDLTVIILQSMGEGGKSCNTNDEFLCVDTVACNYRRRTRELQGGQGPDYFSHHVQIFKSKKQSPYYIFADRRDKRRTSSGSGLHPDVLHHTLKVVETTEEYFKESSEECQTHIAPP